jgi:hypothetical protein
MMLETNIASVLNAGNVSHNPNNSFSLVYITAQAPTAIAIGACVVVLGVSIRIYS